MSLLIKGTDVPRCCFDCEMYRSVKGCCVMTFGPFEHSLERRRVDCPLSEIPTPHGRLIDADKLKVAALEAMCRWTDISITQLINKAPTVIEKEETE